jgi:hypothetical protein
MYINSRDVHGEGIFLSVAFPIFMDDFYPDEIQLGTMSIDPLNII